MARPSKPTTQDTLDSLSAARLREFLTDELAEDAKMRERFVKRFGEPGAAKPSFRSKLDSAFAGMSRQDSYFGPDFGEFLEAAGERAGAGGRDEAIRMYQDICESIYDHMDDVDDSDGIYGDAAGEALVEMVACVNRGKPDHAPKRPYIRYLYRGYMGDEYGFDRHYERALMDLCTRQEDREYLGELHENRERPDRHAHTDLVRFIKSGIRPQDDRQWR
ncbi:MAG: hypothetical protein IS632_08330 [Thaumarchaeota archaeon]|nr:hypothetical protein [Nitrososphaerota archaeon]